MRTMDRAAAERMRSQLARSGATPAAFRSALANVPVHDRDAWLDLVWDIDEIPGDEPELPQGCVPYLPCPVATVLDAVVTADVTASDVFVDVGAGLGRTSALTHLLTGAGCIGVEIQSGLVRAGRGRAAWLNLSRLRFVEGDALELVRFITIGTVFFLYCPFSTDHLCRVLGELEHIARTRQIRVCCVDLPLPDCSWLTPVATPSPGLSVHRSTPLCAECFGGT